MHQLLWKPLHPKKNHGVIGSLSYQLVLKSTKLQASNQLIQFASIFNPSQESTPQALGFHGVFTVFFIITWGFSLFKKLKNPGFGCKNSQPVNPPWPNGPGRRTENSRSNRYWRQGKDLAANGFCFCGDSCCFCQCLGDMKTKQELVEYAGF